MNVRCFAPAALLVVKHVLNQELQPLRNTKKSFFCFLSCTEVLELLENTIDDLLVLGLPFWLLHTRVDAGAEFGDQAQCCFNCVVIHGLVRGLSSAQTHKPFEH